MENKELEKKPEQPEELDEERLGAVTGGASEEYLGKITGSTGGPLKPIKVER